MKLARKWDQGPSGNGAGWEDRARQAEAQAAAAKLLGGMADLVRQAQANRDAEERAELERELERIQRSASWRLTAPLRGIWPRRRAPSVAGGHPPRDRGVKRRGGRPADGTRSGRATLRSGPAIVADARIAAAHRGERYEFRSRADGIGQALRLAWSSDAFLAQVLYRLKSRLQAFGVPIAAPPASSSARA